MTEAKGSKPPAKHRGGCLCGAVAFEVAGDLKDVVACHCSLCRRQTGHFLAFTAAWLEEFKLTESRGLTWYQASPGARRGFCGRCGAVLFYETLGDDKISIAAGSLEGPTGLKLAAHIFVADKGDYYDLEAALPHYARGGDSVPMPARLGRSGRVV